MEKFLYVMGGLNPPVFGYLSLPERVKKNCMCKSSQRNCTKKHRRGHHPSCSSTSVLKRYTPACAVHKAMLCFCMTKSPCSFSSSIITRLDRSTGKHCCRCMVGRMVQRIKKWIGFSKKHCSANRRIHSTLLLVKWQRKKMSMPSMIAL